MSFLAPIQVIGGNGGSSFDFRDTESGASLGKIGVWAGGWQIRGIKIWLTNGQCREFGRDVGDYSEYTFKPGELISSLSLWSNAKSGSKLRLGAIKFKTTCKSSFFSEMTNLRLEKEHPVDVGSGICVGVKGRDGLDIDSLGLIFINSIQSCVLTSITYPTVHEVFPCVAVEELKSITYHNKTNVPQEFKLETKKKVFKTSSWSVSNKMESTFSMRVKAGIPEVAEIEEGFGLKVGLESSYSLEYSEEKDETVSFPIKVSPGRRVSAKITVGRANVDLPYKGTVKVTCCNGSVLEFDVSGVYSGVTFTSADVLVEEMGKS